MAELFGKNKKTISEHISNLFKEGELEDNSVGYRVKSKQGIQFRIWATQRLKEYIIKGFTLNDDRFKTGNSINYFNELQERIR